ncbi:MAG: aminoglycoside phosphotransferase family protein [Acidobacteriota bacterium]|nr:aminoglycoside phosphotransferase family protein [Acidobacteriota bacterium]
MTAEIPTRLVTACQKNAERLNWLKGLPEALRDLQQRWSLTLEDPFEGDEGSSAWVAGATLPDRTAAVLKLSMPHMESKHEIEGLRFWNGDPTVQLLKADDYLDAMLLERCEPGTTLRKMPEAEQDVVIARLLRRLWRPPSTPHYFHPLSAMTACWSAETLAQSENWPDAGLISEGLALFKKLSESAPGDVLLATDLHAGNVLCAQREPWLVIDPKPFVGDPAYDATQHLLNCSARLRFNPERTIRRFAELLGLDHERVRLWAFARTALAAGADWGDAKWLELARVLGR